MGTGIAWTDETWNPIVGCSRVSEGCRHCYAERMAYRLAHMPQAKARYEGLTTKGASGVRWTGKVRLVPEKLEEPLHWRKPRRIFVDSMSDLFHEDVPDEYIDKVFAVMALSPQHTFQVLTKRSERMLRWAEARERYPGAIWDAHIKAGGFAPALGDLPAWPLPNVHLYVSVEDQATANERIPHLLQTPAAVRGVSMEPLLGEVDLTRLDLRDSWPNYEKRDDDPPCFLNALTGHIAGPDDILDDRLNHVIVGGESGPGARPCWYDWLASIVTQCRAADVPCFVKQTGKRLYYDQGRGWRNMKHPKGADLAEWPADLRVQEPAKGGG